MVKQAMQIKLLSKSSSWFLLLDLQTTLHKIETEARRGPNIRGMANAMRIEIIPESCIHQLKWTCHIKSSIYPFPIYWAWNVTFFHDYFTCLAAPMLPQVTVVMRVSVSVKLRWIIRSRVSSEPDDARRHDGVDDGDGPHHEQHGLVQEAEDQLLVGLGAELPADGPGLLHAAAGGQAHVGSARVFGQNTAITPR